MVKGDKKGKFVILVNGCLKTYFDYDEIPNKFESLVSFEPDVPTGPHTYEEHAEIEHWNYRLQRLNMRCN